MNIVLFICHPKSLITKVNFILLLLFSKAGGIKSGCYCFYGPKCAHGENHPLNLYVIITSIACKKPDIRSYEIYFSQIAM